MAEEPGGRVEAEFDVFVAASGPLLLRAAYLLTGDWHAAEDLVQTALERCWPKWSSLHDDGHRIAYVRRVITTSFLRNAKRRWTGELLVDPPAETAGVDDDPDLRTCVRAALRTLPPRQRTAVVLRHLLDLSEADTAAAMRTSRGTVKSNTARGLAALRADPTLTGLLIEETPR